MILWTKIIEMIQNSEKCSLVKENLIVTYINRYFSNILIFVNPKSI